MDMLRQLWRKKQAGSLNEAENEQLEELLVVEENKQVILELMDEEWAAGSGDASFFTEEEKQTVLRNILGATIVSKPIAGVSSMKKWYWAAAAVLLLAAGMYWIKFREQNMAGSADELAVDVNKVQPGKEGAILLLEDGSEVKLDDLHNSGVITEHGEKLALKNGKLAYNSLTDSFVTPEMHRVITPKGRQYNMTLPDGSLVWMNAASSIRFPTVFAKDQRNIELDGEAYFEVTKDAKRPFHIAITGGSEVVVLGTKFNINAYHDENRVKTTLAEGLVRVINNKDSALIKPGQEAIVKNNTAIKVSAADMDKALAWKMGLFSFTGTPINEVLRQFARWYNIDIVYLEDVSDIKLRGKMDRGLSIDQVIQLLNDSGVKCSLEGITLKIGRK